MRAGSFPHASSSTIAFPIKIRHEIRRQTPSVKLSAETAFHYGLGLSAYVPVTILQDRYVNLMMQCQVVHDLIHGEVLYARDEIDLIRYRLQEELRQLDRLRHRRERYLILRNLSESTDSLFSAVVLYLRRDGALIELVDFPPFPPDFPRFSDVTGKNHGFLTLRTKNLGFLTLRADFGKN